MRGWECVGRLFDAGFMLDAAFVREDDILRLSPYHDARAVALRSGEIRARDAVALKWQDLHALIPAAAHGDHVFRATALGEHAFKPSTPPADE